MTSRARTWVFMLCATLGNVLCSIILFIALLALYAATLGKILAPDAVTWAMLVCFLAAMVGTAFLYRFVVKKFGDRWRLDSMIGGNKRSR